MICVRTVLGDSLVGQARKTQPLRGSEEAGTQACNRSQVLGDEMSAVDKIARVLSEVNPVCREEFARNHNSKELCLMGKVS